MKLFSLIILFSLSLINQASNHIIAFDTQAKTKRYYTLIDQIRCPVCQGQSIGGSNADLAKDLRQQVVKMLNNNKSNDDIHTFMTARYGDFAVFKPPIKNTTLILWFAPFILLLIVLIMVFYRIRNNVNLKTKPSIDTSHADKYLD